MQTLLVGSLLGIESDTHYTLCFLTDQSSATAHVLVDGELIEAMRIADTYHGAFWRAEIKVVRQKSSRHVTYSVQLDKQVVQDSKLRKTPHLVLLSH